MEAKKNRISRGTIMLIASLLFLVFITIAIVFSIMLFTKLCSSDACSTSDLYYDIAVIFSSLAFGVATLGLSALTYKGSRESDKAYEREVISKCRTRYSEIISTHEFIFIKEIFDQISADHNFCVVNEPLDAAEDNLVLTLKNDFRKFDYLINYIEPNLYLIAPNSVKISKKNKRYELSLVTLLASYTRSVLAKFASITEVYANGILEESEFEADFLDSILSVHLMSVILNNYYSFYCTNVRVRCDLKIYFENKMKEILSI